MDNADWRLKYIWPSLMPWIAGLNIGIGWEGSSFVNLGLGVLTTVLTIYIVWENVNEKS